jgi:hypothetical protein
MEAMDMFIEKATIAITKPSTNKLGIKANGGATAFGSLEKNSSSNFNVYPYTIHDMYAIWVQDMRNTCLINIVFII